MRFFLPVFPLQRTPGRKETILGALIIQNVRMILSAHPERFRMNGKQAVFRSYLQPYLCAEGEKQHISDDIRAV